MFAIPRRASGRFVDGGRLWQSLMELAEIGATPKGGVRRLALTDLDRQGRDLVVGWLRDAGANTEIDGAGNIFAIRPGRDPAARVVLTGSHVDTQPSGGKFDGNYGVLAGLEVLRTLNDAKVATDKPVGVAIWTNEEGSRFVPVMGGSGAFAGRVHARAPAAAARRRRRYVRRRARVASGMRAARPSAGARSTRISRRTSSRGPFSSARDKIVGVVTGALGLRWYDCVWTGQDAHAGPDADGSASRRAARRVAVRRGGQRAGAAPCARRPSHGGIHAGQPEFAQRHPRAGQDEPSTCAIPTTMHLATMDRELATRRRAIAADLRLECDLQQVDHFPASRFDAELRRRGARRNARARAIRTGRWSAARATMRSMSRASPRRR